MLHLVSVLVYLFQLESRRFQTLAGVLYSAPQFETCKDLWFCPGDSAAQLVHDPSISMLALRVREILPCMQRGLSPQSVHILPTRLLALAR